MQFSVKHLWWVYAMGPHESCFDWHLMLLSSSVAVPSGAALYLLTMHTKAIKSYKYCSKSLITLGHMVWFSWSLLTGNPQSHTIWLSPIGCALFGSVIWFHLLVEISRLNIIFESMSYMHPEPCGCMLTRVMGPAVHYLLRTFQCSLYILLLNLML